MLSQSLLPDLRDPKETFWKKIVGLAEEEDSKRLDLREMVEEDKVVLLVSHSPSLVEEDASSQETVPADKAPSAVALEAEVALVVDREALAAALALDQREETS